MPESMVRRECPLSTCDWRHDEPDRVRGPNLFNFNDLADIDKAAIRAAGGDVVFAVLLADYTRVEAILREHFETHPLEEWVMEVVRLRESIRRPAADVRWRP